MDQRRRSDPSGVTGKLTRVAVRAAPLTLLGVQQRSSASRRFNEDEAMKVEWK